MVEAPTDAIVVMDVPLLVESKTAAEWGYEVVIVVEAPEHVRLDRLEGRGLDRADAAARMKAQATDEERRAVATHLLDNGTDPDALVAQVDALWSDLRARHDAKDQPESQNRAAGRPNPGTDFASIHPLGLWTIDPENHTSLASTMTRCTSQRRDRPASGSWDDVEPPEPQDQSSPRRKKASNPARIPRGDPWSDE